MRGSPGCWGPVTRGRGRPGGSLRPCRSCRSRRSGRVSVPSIAAALCATDGGSAGPRAASDERGWLGKPARRPGRAGSGNTDAGRIVRVCPLRSVTVKVFAALSITTLLWMLTKITLLGGGGCT